MNTTQHTNEIEQNYDDNPYYSFSYEQSAPEHLAAVAHVFGLSAPDVSKARVLELGCAAGRNLIPFAVRNPGARAIGVDPRFPRVDLFRDLIHGRLVAWPDVNPLFDPISDPIRTPVS